MIIKKKILLGIAVMAMFSVTTFFNIEPVKADGGVSCRCTWFSGNCAANGWGQKCTTHTPCYTHSKECARRPSCPSGPQS